MKSKIQEALEKLLPEGADDVVAAVTAELDTAKTEIKKTLEKEFNGNLDEAYKTLSQQLVESEETAYEGYQQARAVILDLRNRLELQKEEYEVHMEKEFGEAAQLLKDAWKDNEGVEVEIYEEMENRLSEMKKYLVEKVDKFLHFKTNELTEMAQREVLNSPVTAEHKVAIDKIANVISDYYCDDDFDGSTSKKLEEERNRNEQLEGQLKISEARNFRHETETNKLQRDFQSVVGQLNESNELIKESARQERAGKAANAEGRGKVVSDSDLIKEYDESDEPNEELQNEGAQKLAENAGSDLDDWKKLAGISQSYNDLIII